MSFIKVSGNIIPSSIAKEYKNGLRIDPVDLGAITPLTSPLLDLSKKS